MCFKGGLHQGPRSTQQAETLGFCAHKESAAGTSGEAPVHAEGLRTTGLSWAGRATAHRRPPRSVEEEQGAGLGSLGPDLNVKTPAWHLLSPCTQGGM